MGYFGPVLKRSSLPSSWTPGSSSAPLPSPSVISVILCLSLFLVTFLHTVLLADFGQYQCCSLRCKSFNSLAAFSFSGLMLTEQHTSEWLGLFLHIEFSFFNFVLFSCKGRFWSKSYDPTSCTSIKVLYYLYLNSSLLVANKSFKLKKKVRAKTLTEYFNTFFKLNETSDLLMISLFYGFCIVTVSSILFSFMSDFFRVCR